MDSRERTFLALSRTEPDRVPIDFWSSRGVDRNLGLDDSESRQSFLDEHDVDLRYVDGPRYVGAPLRTWADGTSEDIWGVRRINKSVPVAYGREDYREVSASPLSSAVTVDDVERYGHWPSPDWFDYSAIALQCERVRDQGRVAVFVGDRLNRVAQLKPAMYVRGVQQILLDMALRPDLVKAVIGKIRQFYVTYLVRILEAARGKLDILLTGDDYGSQRGPLISPAMWREYLGGGFEEYVSLAKQAGVLVMHHTCGSVRPIVPLMMDRGLDILQSLQPEASGMNPRELKANYGDRLSFHGGISIQQTLPHGHVDDVRRAVASVFQALAPGGGYIACTSHNIQADTPPGNVTALLRAYHEIGQY